MNFAVERTVKVHIEPRPNDDIEYQLFGHSPATGVVLGTIKRFNGEALEVSTGRGLIPVYPNSVISINGEKVVR